ncbi:MAG TPA: ferritin family protein [bacterium]|nr:ferritin family protein [bacterium]
MTRKINELSPKEILALAIHIEQANKNRLRNFAHAFSGYDQEVEGKFNELAEEEGFHEAWLQQKFEKMFKGPVPKVTEFDVEEVVEAVEWDDSEHQIFDSLKAENVYRLALDAENGARNFYQVAIKTVKEKSLVKLFKELAGMENDHVEWLKKRIGVTGKKPKKNGEKP